MSLEVYNLQPETNTQQVELLKNSLTEATNELVGGIRDDEKIAKYNELLNKILGIIFEDILPLDQMESLLKTVSLLKNHVMNDVRDSTADENDKFLHNNIQGPLYKIETQLERKIDKEKNPVRDVSGMIKF
jgi:hypothetical protein